MIFADPPYFYQIILVIMANSTVNKGYWDKPSNYDNIEKSHMIGQIML